MLRVEYPRGFQWSVGAAGAVFGVLAGGMGLSLAFSPPPETEADVVGAVRALGALLAVLGIGIILGAIRSMFAGVRIGTDGVAVRSTWRRRSLALGEVRAFEVVDTTGAIPLIPFCCFGVRLEDDSTTVVRELKALSRRRATEAVARANDQLWELKKRFG